MGKDERTSQRCTKLHALKTFLELRTHGRKSAPADRQKDLSNEMNTKFVARQLKQLDQLTDRRYQ